MKKGSTARQKLTIGLDLGDRSSWYCVLSETGEVLLEQKLGTTPKAMKEVFGGMPRSRVALETGMHSPWVSRLLSGLGHEVIVAHARNVRLIGESRKKDDRLDAQTLARLARIDPQLLSPVKHRSAKAQADLTVIRARAGLVRARTALTNTARGLAKSYGEQLRRCNVRNMNPEKAERLSPELQQALEPLLAASAALSEQIAECLFAGPVPSLQGLGVGLYQSARQATVGGYRLALASNVKGKVCFALIPVVAKETVTEASPHSPCG